MEIDLEVRINDEAEKDLKKMGKLNKTPLRMLRGKLSYKNIALQLYREMDQPIGFRYPYRLSRAADLHVPKKREDVLLVAKSLEQGIVEISQRISEDDTERSLIYIPSISTWIDDMWANDGVTCSGDPALNVYLTRIFPEIYWIHTHPDKTLEDLYQKRVRSAQYLVEAATPTSGDLISLTQQQSQGNRACRIIGGIISHFGFTTYEFSEENRRLFQGGVCASYEANDVNPHENPVTEIKRILGEQVLECNMVQFEDKIVPAFKFGFTPY